MMRNSALILTREIKYKAILMSCDLNSTSLEIEIVKSIKLLPGIFTSQNYSCNKFFPEDDIKKIYKPGVHSFYFKTI